MVLVWAFQWRRLITVGGHAVTITRGFRKQIIALGEIESVGLMDARTLDIRTKAGAVRIVTRKKAAVSLRAAATAIQNKVRPMSEGGAM
jgi:hypothetical protein